MSFALQIFAGPRARQRLRERGLAPADVRIIPAAAGGPKGLVLNALDQYLFGDWLPRGDHEVHLVGASIGAWRMATACLTRSAADVQHEFDRLANEYAHQRYDEPELPPDGAYRMPDAATVTRGFSAKLDEVFGGRESLVLSHPKLRLHIFTSRGRHVLGREGRIRTPLGYLAAFGANVLNRRMLGAWLERVVFSDPRAPLPLPLNDFRSRQVGLDEGNVRASLLASCSIPFWLKAVHDIPGAPRGAYWDGGITDYHLHLNYAAMGEGLVLYPHFQRQVVPGWLDKALKHRHGSTAFLDNLIVLAPHPDWVAQLPRAKLPDREDFKHYGTDVAGRAKAWLRAVAQGQQLRDEFAAACAKPSIDALPL
ncbi:MAG: phospholipase [Paucibacter sp.]|nr:phospholipase [Roseateles sp.]